MRLARNVATAVAIASVTLIAPACSRPAAPKRAQVLPFIEDDYTRALAEARSRKLPIFVDSWVPW